MAIHIQDLVTKVKDKVVLMANIFCMLLCKENLAIKQAQLRLIPRLLPPIYTFYDRHMQSVNIENSLSGQLGLANHYAGIIFGIIAIGGL